MKPINEVDRKKATKGFVIIYGLSLITVLLMSYFLFSSPVKVLKDDVKTHSIFKLQHDALMHKLNEISQKNFQLSRAGSENSSLDAEYKKEISKLLVDLKSYSDKETIPQVKEDLNNYLSAYTAVLHFHENKSKLLPAEDVNGGNVIPAEPGNSNESDEITKLSFVIKTLNTEKTKLINENKRLLGLLDEGNGESINRNWQAKLTEIEKERDVYKNQLASRSEDSRNKDEIIKVLKKEKENLIIECEKKTAPPPSNTEDNSKLFQAVDKVIRKPRHTKKDVLVDFNQILRSVENTYPQKPLLEKKIGEINKLLTGDF